MAIIGDGDIIRRNTIITDANGPALRFEDRTDTALEDEGVIQIYDVETADQLGLHANGLVSPFDINLFAGTDIRVTATDEFVVTADSAKITATDIGFYDATPVAQQTGVAVTAEAIHAALVALGLITA